MRRSRVAFAVILSLLAVALPLAASAQPAPPQPVQIINLGHVEVWAVPDEPPPPPPDPQAIKSGAAFVTRSQPVSLEEARASVDFALLFPASLPDGLPLAQVQTLALPGSSGQVILIYRDPGRDPRADGPRELVISQRRWAGITRIMMPRLLEVGSVAGRPAVFWSLSLPPDAPIVTRDSVMFEQSDLLVSIDAAGLSRAELLLIAESLAESP